MKKSKNIALTGTLCALCLVAWGGCGSLEKGDSDRSVEKVGASHEAGGSSSRVLGRGRTEVVISYRANMGTKKETVKRERVLCSASDDSRLCRKIASLTRKTMEYWVPKGDCLVNPETGGSPRGGSRPCREIEVRRSPLDPLPPGQRCTMAAGGEIDASIIGLIQGQRVRARFTDMFNCEGDRWWKVEPVFAMLRLFDDVELTSPFFRAPENMPNDGGVLEAANE